jgi:cephalosporin hydroxylase
MREHIPGWDPIVHIYREWLKTPPRLGAVVVEVGVALGRSLSFVADWCIAHDRRDIEVWAVDSWAHNAPNGEQQTMASVAGGDFSLYAKMMLEHDPKAFEFIRPLRATSERAARLFTPGSVDLCVIDGDHSREGCLTDIRSWLPLIRSGGWLGGDDHHEVHEPGVVEACKEAFGSDYEVTEKANGWADGRAWVKRVA